MFLSNQFIGDGAPINPQIKFKMSPFISIFYTYTSVQSALTSCSIHSVPQHKGVWSTAHCEHPLKGKAQAQVLSSFNQRTSPNPNLMSEHSLYFNRLNNMTELSWMCLIFQITGANITNPAGYYLLFTIHYFFSVINHQNFTMFFYIFEGIP